MDDHVRPRGTLHLNSARRARQQHLSAGQRLRANPADGKAIALEATRWAHVVASRFAKMFADGQKAGARRWATRTTAPRLAVRKAFYQGKTKQETVDLLVEVWGKGHG
jgi:hypothetical protein